MCEGMSCGAMMWGGWVVGIPALVVLLLGPGGSRQIPSIEVSRVARTGGPAALAEFHAIDSASPHNAAVTTALLAGSVD